MNWMILLAFGVNVIELIVVVYLMNQVDFLTALANKLIEIMSIEDVEPKDGGMNLLLLKANNKTRKQRRFTDKSREWLSAHERESRR